MSNVIPISTVSMKTFYTVSTVTGQPNVKTGINDLNKAINICEHSKPLRHFEYKATISRTLCISGFGRAQTCVTHKYKIDNDNTLTKISIRDDNEVLTNFLKNVKKYG